MCRYVQSSQTDLPGPANAELRLREERLSRRVCSACCRPFSLLTNRWDIYSIIYTIYTISIYTLYNNILRRLLCSNCLLGVCRACASFQPRDQVWVCRRCSGARYSSDSIALVDDKLWSVSQMKTLTLRVTEQTVDLSTLTARVSCRLVAMPCSISKAVTAPLSGVLYLYNIPVSTKLKLQHCVTLLTPYCQA